VILKKGEKPIPKPVIDLDIDEIKLTNENRAKLIKSILNASMKTCQYDIT